MMKKRLDHWITVIAFCGAMAIMAALFLVLPERDFSETEKRYLEKFPTFSWEKLASGEFGADIETYMADHIPGRDFLVGLNAYFENVTGRQVAKDIYCAEDGRLVEKPVQWNGAQAAQNMMAINLFAETIGTDVDFMIVPSGGWAVEEHLTGFTDPYMDEQYIADLYALAGENLNTMDMVSLFKTMDGRDLYYRTDHHWTSKGAYMAYRHYMQQKGKPYRLQQQFTIQTEEGFYGTTYSRSALWLTQTEPLEMWHGSQNLQVTNGETEGVHAGVFYEERLEEIDKYTVYLDGNHSMVRIENPDNAGKGKLLVIRDSYANCLGCFLAESYETVVLVDLRYYKNPISELYAQEGFDDVLVSYSLSNFMTDTNLVWLR